MMKRWTNIDKIYNLSERIKLLQGEILCKII